MNTVIIINSICERYFEKNTEYYNKLKTCLLTRVTGCKSHLDSWANTMIYNYPSLVLEVKSLIKITNNE